MQKGILGQQVLPYIKRHWFKLGLGALVIFVFLKKDFSFQINLRAPQNIEQQIAPSQQTARKKKEVLTDASATPVAKKKSPVIDKLSMLFIGGEEKSDGHFKEFMAISDSKKETYMKRFAHIAVAEMEKYGIPASIVLSSALLQSQAGQRDVALNSNNHFATPCTSDWRGSEESYQGKCYREYDSAWGSFRDHTLFLTTGKNTSFKKLGRTNYKDWAQAIGKTDLNESGHLGKNLITIIEQYQLHQLDE
ncbi:MAG: glucosaminidase domain-containing protein [Saprospiraceae bacterium]